MSTTTQQEAGRRIPRDTLALRVRIAREELGLSQRAAAAQCGLTFGEWQSIEAGREARGLDHKVARIATGLDYDRDWLMWGGPLDDGSHTDIGGYSTSTGHGFPAAA